EPIALVPLEALQAVAALAPTDKGRPNKPSARVISDASPLKSTYTSTHRLKVDIWLNARGVKYSTKTLADGRTAYVLEACPFNASPTNPDACVMQATDGALSANCFHDSCAGKGWQEFKAAIGPPDPDHYDPPLQSRREARSAAKQEEETADK